MLGATLFCVSITQLYVFESDWKDGAPDGEVRGRTPYEHRSLHTHETDDLAGGNDCRVYFLPVTLVALIGRVAPVPLMKKIRGSRVVQCRNVSITMNGNR